MSRDWGLLQCTISTTFSADAGVLLGVGAPPFFDLPPDMPSVRCFRVSSTQKSTPSQHTSLAPDSCGCSGPCNADSTVLKFFRTWLGDSFLCIAHTGDDGSRSLSHEACRRASSMESPRNTTNWEFTGTPQDILTRYSSFSSALHFPPKWYAATGDFEGTPAFAASGNPPGATGDGLERFAF